MLAFTIVLSELSHEVAIAEHDPVHRRYLLEAVVALWRFHLQVIGRVKHQIHFVHDLEV